MYCIVLCSCSWQSEEGEGFRKSVLEVTTVCLAL